MFNKPWCEGKTAYCCKADAIKRIECQRRMRGRKRSTGWSKDQTLVPYHCSNCKHWHVGGTSKHTLHTRDPKNGKPLHRHPREER